MHKFKISQQSDMSIIGRRKGVIEVSYSFRIEQCSNSRNFSIYQAFYLSTKKRGGFKFDKCPHTYRHNVPFLCQTYTLASCYFCCNKSYELTIWLVVSFAHFYSQCSSVLHHILFGMCGGCKDSY